jgi:hypothetical protein
MADEFTREEVESVANKLNQFAEGLSDSERQVLAWMIARAEAGGDDVKGYLSSFAPYLSVDVAPYLLQRPWKRDLSYRGIIVIGG